MKKNFIILMLSVAAVFGCSTTDDALVDRVTDVQRRLMTWEQQRDSLAAELAKMQAIVTAINNKDWVQSVTEITDNSGKVIGYTLNFSQSGNVTILNGKEGQAPVIGVKLASDGYYYWTLDGEYMLDADGKKVQASPNINGISIKDGVTPQLKIEDGWWYVSYDQGAKWTKLGQAGGGSAASAFREVDVTNLAYVRIVLMDDTELMIPRYAAVRIGDGTSNEAIEIEGETTVQILLPPTIKENEICAIKAVIETSGGRNVDVVTKAPVVKAPWKVELVQPTFTEGTYNNDAAVKVTPAADAENGDAVLLEVSVVDKNGQITSTARALEYIVVIKPEDCENLSANGNANCYMIQKGGMYRIDATVIGNGNAGIIDPAFHVSDATISPAAAKIVWSDEGLVSSVSVAEGKWLMFSVADGVKGNAVIEVLSKADKVLWSWHIWVTDTPADVSLSNASGNYSLMDRNLGATAATKDDGSAAYGLYYQWGRKDPFRKNPEKISETAAAVAIKTAVEAPETFFKVAATSDSWEVGKIAKKWDDNAKSIYDPCPAGYRVCTHAQLTVLGDKAATATYDNGLEMSGLWFPAAGNLKPQDGSYASARTDYWASTMDAGDRPFRLYIKKDTWNTTSGCNAYAFSIRCVKE